MQDLKGRPAIIYGRFSSKQQKNSISRKRQIEQALAFVANNEMTMLDGGVWFDAGVSGYRGKHRLKGELGKLLAGIESGAVPSDAVLVVESIDRLSRENPLEAITLIKDIIDSGVTVFTIHDRQFYGSDRMNKDPSAIFLLIASMQRAHSEAEARSERSKASWAYKRDMMAKGEAPRMQRPFWIGPDGKLIPKRAEVVRRIFSMYINDRMGIRPIAIALNADNVPPPTTRAKEWRFAQISRYIKDPRTIGLFGADQIYPPAIERDVYAEAQRILATQQNKGPVHNGWSSALRGLSLCHACGCGLRASATRKTSRTMYCRRSLEGVCDISGGINYKLILLFTVWAASREMAHIEAQHRPSGTVRRDISPEIKALDKEIDQLSELAAMTGNISQIAIKIKERQERKTSLIKEFEEQLKVTERDSFTDQMEWLTNEMPALVAVALSADCKEASQRLNQRFTESDSKVTWDGKYLYCGDHKAKRDYKRLVIEGEGVIQLAEDGTQELGGGWWFLAKPGISK
jgi:DNA invertase Pin-like site-specific DNA recombinase